MSDDFIPAEVFPLSDLLIDEMKERGWTTDDVAERMPGDKPTNCLRIALIIALQIDGMILTEDDYAALSAAFGASADFFRNYHGAWLKWPDRRSAPEEAPDEVFGPLTLSILSRCRVKPPAATGSTPTTSNTAGEG